MIQCPLSILLPTVDHGRLFMQVFFTSAGAIHHLRNYRGQGSKIKNANRIY